MFLVLFFCRLFVLSAIIHIQLLWAASIDGLRPTWQPAIITYIITYYMYISLANKIVVVVVRPSACLYVRNAVHCGAQGQCRWLKVVLRFPSTQLPTNFFRHFCPRMYHLATKRSEKRIAEITLVSNSLRLSESRTQATHCAANGKYLRCP